MTLESFALWIVKALSVISVILSGYYIIRREAALALALAAFSIAVSLLR